MLLPSILGFLHMMYNPRKYEIDKSYYPLYWAFFTEYASGESCIKYVMLLPSILGFLHNSIFNTFCFYLITFFQNFNYFYRKSVATYFLLISKNPIFMHLCRLSYIFLLYLFRLTHFFKQTNIPLFLY